jgi:hypothetical protein
VNGFVMLAVLASNSYLLDGRRYFSNLDFEAATRALAVAVEQPDLTPAERIESLDLLAR